jgi:hypothetical protein
MPSISSSSSRIKGRTLLSRSLFAALTLVSLGLAAAMCCLWILQLRVLSESTVLQQQQQDTPINTNTVRKNKQTPQQTVTSTTPNTTPVTNFHIVFSTGCSDFQDWQSYAFFYHVLNSNQPGNITRVASGCSAENEVLLRHQFASQIQPMSDRFYLHVTPDYAHVANDTYKFFNKPYGLHHWMEYGLKYQENRALYEDTIFIILDPDEIIVRPFSQDYAMERMAWHDEPHSHYSIQKGQPMSQLYGFGSNYASLINASELFGPDNVGGWTDWSHEEMDLYYAAGPPYMAVGSDMFALIKTWKEIAVPVYVQTKKNHLSEMFAYSVAAKFLRLQHQLAHSYMVSNVDVQQEGWPLTDQLGNDVCGESVVASNKNKLPHVLHFCQTYNLGTYMIV